MMRTLIAALVAAAILAPSAAATGPVDVIVDAGTTTLTTASGGTHTAQVVLTNLRARPLPVEAAVLSQIGCGVKPNPSQVQPSRKTTVTLTLDTGCDVASGLSISLALGAAPVASSPTVIAAPAAASPRWDIVSWSFLISLGVACALVAYLGSRIRRYNRLKPKEKSGSPDPGMHPPIVAKPQATDVGPVPEGTYVYTASTVTGRHRWQRVESHPTAFSNEVNLDRSSAIELTIEKADVMDVHERRIYRSRVIPNSDEVHFRRVGEVKGADETQFRDGWVSLGATSELKGLGTNWSFKDNWIGNVTIGATVLVALFASSSTFGAIIGPSANPALTAMAVAAAVASILVGIGPLLVKVIGDDLVAGMLAGAFFTIFGTIGQIAADTWEVAVSTPHVWIETGVVFTGVLLAGVVLWYAEVSLWYYLKTGALLVQPNATKQGLAGEEKHTALI